MDVDRLGAAVIVKSDRERLPADGCAYATLQIQLGAEAGETVELRLAGPGSFDPHIRLRRISLPVRDGLAQAHVYAPRRPGHAVVKGPGFTHRLEFSPVSLVQGLVFEWVPTIALALVIALVLRTYAFASYYIPSESMLDTMRIGDLFFAENVSYKVLRQEPQRGDIVVFRHPQEGQHNILIKRVIGLPGDTVEVQDGQVLINGEALAEDYIAQPPLRAFPRHTVPADSYFVMGDNRNNSADSRVWGYLPRENLLGRAALVFWPPQRMRVLERVGY